MLYRFIIKDIAFYAYHGVLQQERDLGQKYLVSLELSIELPQEPHDNIEKTYDYRVAVEAARRVMNGASCLLLETLANRIAEEVMQSPQVKGARVSVMKANPPIAGVEGGVSVELFLARE